MIAITGGSGAMGTRLVRLFLAGGEKVRIIDRVPPLGRTSEVEFRRADIRDLASLTEALAGCSSVVHMAALLLARGDEAQLVSINRDGTGNVLAAMESLGIRRLVHVSSISVLYRLQNAYSRSKARAEDLVRSSDRDWTILRPSLAWGDASAKEHEIFVRTVRRWPLLPLPEGGRAMKSPVHVDDLAQAFSACLRNGDSIGRSLDLAGGRTLSLRTMASEIRANSGTRSRIIGMPRGVATSIARSAPFLRAVGIPAPLDWQTLTGLLEDAAPSTEAARTLLGFGPRPWKAP